MLASCHADPKSLLHARPRLYLACCLYRGAAWLALAIAARTRRAARGHVQCVNNNQEEAMESVCALLLVAVLPPVVLLLVTVAGRAAASGLGALARAHFAWPAGSQLTDTRKCGSRAAPGQPDHELRVSLYSRGKKEGCEEEAEAVVECVFCLSGVEEGDEVRELRCRHVFHRACLDRWLATPPATCPLCRSLLLTAPPPGEDEEDLDSDLLLLMAYVHGGGGGGGSGRWFWSP